MGEKITTVEFAKTLGITTTRVRQLIFDGIIQADKIGRDWLIDEDYIETVKNRPENRGRKPLKKAA